MRQSTGHVAAGMDGIPEEVLWAGPDMTVAIEIMFVNKLSLFITISCEIKFEMVRSIPNRQVTKIRQCLQRVVDLYTGRGLIVRLKLAVGSLNCFDSGF
jgi:hypothetical protein